VIRHTKSQHIGGAAALALPEAACETVWIDMNPSERTIYTKACVNCAHRLPALIAEPQKAKLFAVENAITPRRQACCGADGVLPRFLQRADHPPPTGRKLRMLLDDLAELRQTEPALHAVVFTHHTDAYERISKALKRAGFEVCGFTGGVQAAQRHRTIRAFQESAEASVDKGGKRPKLAAKVFVATMKAGNVGMTLTAATRVYLMEPCLCPTMEVQAAGRIHRLGQTKDVLVKRFCYKNSIDGAIVELHKKISSGTLSIVDNLFPIEALKILQTHQ
jgi:SNF2 family DNA or RNA helicase